MNVTRNLIDRIIKAKAGLKKYRGIVTGLAALVVFVTTYMLILPAITMVDSDAQKTPGIGINNGISIGTDSRSNDMNDADESVSKADSEKKADSEAPTNNTAQDEGISHAENKDPAKSNTDSKHKNKAKSEKGSIEKTDVGKKASGDNKKNNDNQLLAKKTELKFNGKGFKAVAECGADTKLPADVKLQVKEVKDGTRDENGNKYDYDDYCGKALKAVRDKDGKEGKNQLRRVRLYDISFVSESTGETFEPDAKVKVKIKFDKTVKINDIDKVRAVHFDETKKEMKAEVLGAKTEMNSSKEMKKASFESDKFSVFGVVYTVDFHSDVDGKKFEYSIPGGGYMSFEKLIEVLGIAENGEQGSSKDDPTLTNNSDLTMDDIEVSKATKDFTADVEKVEFSDSGLMWVKRVDKDSTVGQLKEDNGLKVKYSAELTKEQIEKINAQKVESGDWALISLKEFDTEETLSVTMKNGDQFVVKVTDASKLAVNYDSLNAVIDANNGSAKFLLYATKDSVNYYLKNDGSTTTTPPSESTLNNYTWTVSISNRNNHQYYFKGRNGLYLNLNENGLTSTSSGAVILTQDGTQFKMTTSSRSMGWDGNNNQFYKRDDINPAKFSLYYVDPSGSSGGSSGTPGIVLTDKERQDLETWKDTLAKFNTLTDYDKTAEVVGDGDNRMYKVDLNASSGIMDFYKDVDLGFVLDVSNSMKFPSSLKAISNTQIMMTQSDLDNYYWSHQSDYNREGCFYIISDPAVTSTIYKVFYDSNGTWKYVDASEPSTTTKKYTITDSTVIGKDGYRKPYTLYYADDTKDRFSYLKESVDYAVQTLHKIVKPTEGTDDETANVRLAYNFFCATITKSEDFKDLRDAANNNFTIPLSYEYTDSGTKQNEALYDGNHSISGLSANEFGWKNGSDQYVILVTDGAPNGPSMQDVRDAARNLKNRYPNVKIITIGLSTKDVEGGSQMLYDIADDVDGDGQPEFYEAEKAKDLEYIMLKILQSIMAKGTVKGTITDTIDKAFYPVDASGNPLSEGVYNASGKINEASISDYVANGKPTAAHKYDAFYTLEQVEGNWRITWYNQKIGWDDGLAETGTPWKGTVYVKAKEDYLGGNLIETNDSASIEPTGLKLVINHQEEPNWRDLVDMPQLGYPVPRVNVHNLETKENSTSWTVYKGTTVTPGDQIKALWNDIPIEEVVSSTKNNEHKITTDSGANVGSSGTGETFTLGSLMSEVAPSFDIDSLINQITASKTSASQEFTYTAYGHESGKITVKVERTVGNKTPATHTADTVGTPVEQYKVTFKYKPYTEAERMNGKVKDPNDINHHNGTNGRGAEETGSITSSNTHTINVFQKAIKLTKVDKTNFNNKLTGATFELFRIDPAGNADVSKYNLPEGNYTKVGSDLTVDSQGIITIDPVIPDKDTTVNDKNLYLPNIDVGTTENNNHETVFYLVEKTPPETYAAMPGAIKFTMKLSENKGNDPKSMLYDWTQSATISATEYQNGSTKYLLEDGENTINGTTSGIYAYKIKNGKATDITLIKVDKKTGVSIGGAKFCLIRGSENVDLTQLTITALNGGTSVTPEDYDFNGTSIKVVTVPEGGIRIAGLVDDTYTLREVAAPAGYLITDSGKTFKTENGVIKETDDTSHTNEATNINFKVKNEQGAELPSAGGSGTTWIYILGALLTIGGGMAFVVRRRMRA